ncbi:uncharacterized protein F5147DRAFT_651151 [Suillus discolor]|uniref:Uncharacterized protein n=1 Tax=Suillus discolor TaxID=1912936 RepID=A0A9P7JWA7_9AGAM|nr:uncharacterized protein F5147DRAFT_651151 [Suillus discolor]KAG2112049.1 hypothetical protein F5147DRAFT_651151 [Suillus discolor]
MPVAHQHICHSARLRANTRVHSRAMDPRESFSNVPLNLPPEAPAIKMSIQWQSKNALTDVLVNYLTTHPSDCRVLFYSEGKKKMSPADDNPSGKDKGDIYGIITHLIFGQHIKYGPAYHQNPKKFHDSVSNHVSGTKYKKHKSQFTATGAGVILFDGTSRKNLLERVLADLPWYSDLDSIWHSNPSIAAKTHSFKPGVDHAGTLYSLVQSRGGACPSMHFGATAPPPNA